MIPTDVHDELTAVLRHYAVGDLISAQRIEKGFVNDNWDVSTDLGRFFLKRRRAEPRRPHIIRAQHDLMRWIRQAGFPAPAVLSTQTGDSILDLEGQVYEIQEYIAGEPYDFGDPSHLGEAARTLARYHGVVEGFETPVLSGLGELYSPSRARKLLGALGEAWQFVDDQELTSLSHALDAFLLELIARFSTHGALPRLAIHGDYYADNLLFDRNRIVGVVDFDKSRWQPRVVELAEAVIFFASPQPRHLRHLVYSGFLEWASFEQFLRHYASENALLEQEICALPAYVSCIWVQMSLANLIEKERVSEAGETLLELLALATWARDNARSLEETALRITS